MANYRIVNRQTFMAGVSGGVRVQPASLVRRQAIEVRALLRGLKSRAARRGLQARRRPAMVVGLSGRRRKTIAADVYPRGKSLAVSQPAEHSMIRLLVATFCLAAASAAFAADDAAALATVGNESILLGEARQCSTRPCEARSSVRNCCRTPGPKCWRNSLPGRLVLAYAQRLGELPTDEEIASALRPGPLAGDGPGPNAAGRAGGRFGQRGRRRRQIAWNVAWQKYLAKYLTTEREEAYFQAHRRDLDGTEVSGSATSCCDRPPPARRRWSELFGRRRRSAGTSLPESSRWRRRRRRIRRVPAAATAGGSAGSAAAVRWTRPFSRAAFALESRRASPPVRSPFGVHLIRADEIKPGSKKLSDVARRWRTLFGASFWRSSPAFSGRTPR